MDDLGFDLPDDSEEEVPDGFDGFGYEDQPEPESSFEGSAPGEHDSSIGDSPIPPMDEDSGEIVPDWMDGIHASEGAEESRPAEPPRDDAPGEGDPAWLENIRQLEQDRQQQESSAPPFEDFEDYDVDSGSSQPQGAGFTSSEPQEAHDQTAGQDSGPDWLSGLSGDDHAEAEAPDPLDEEYPPQQVDDLHAPETSELEPADQLFSFEDTGSLPSWLVEIKRGEAASGVAPSHDSLAFDAQQDQDDPFSPTADFDLTSGDLSNLLSEVPPSDVPAEIEPETPGSEPPLDLARANLPNWLHAMRPVDSPSGPDEVVVGREETLGPLAGLQSLIPAEPDIIQFGKSPSFSFELDVTASHERSTGIFEELITTEGKPKKSRLPVEAITQGAVRWVIALLLLLSTAVPIMLGSEGVVLPAVDPLPEAVASTKDLVLALPPEGLVLAAFDYQPSFTGELSAPAAAVLDHLLSRGAQLAIVSTLPTGAAQGVSFLQQNLADRHFYVAEHLYTDLGYLAAGPAGLRAFALSPSEALPVYAAGEGDPVSLWTKAPLDRVGSVADFAMVLVLTDSPEVARSWIEQVEPLMGETPLLMIVSEQTEPFLIPYYRSEPKQLDAFMAGLGDAVYYDGSLGTGQLSRSYWNSYRAGIGISVAVIFLGTLVGAALMLMARLKKPSREAKS